ncbi:MAG: GMC oxidoreductase [Pseudomonadota bacterium]
MAQDIDYLILGGGSAGCVLAARLSETSDKTVMLIEAGRDVTKSTMTENVGDRYPGRAFMSPANVWTDLEARISGGKDGKSNPPRLYEQGKLLGGSSAINAMVANRGAPDDYDEWGRLGAEGWSWDVALPYFRKLESDADIDDQYHGKEGPIPVRRLPEAKVSPFIRAMKKSLQKNGELLHADQNGKWEDGVFPATITVSDDGHRVPTSVAYLTPDVRARANLTIKTDTVAETLTFRDGRASGVHVRGKDSLEEIAAREVIVTMGGIHSAAFLLRSGIGPAAELQELGIEVVHDLPGVGKNLMEHPLIAVSAFLPPKSRMPDLDEHHDQALLRWTSSIEDAPQGDMHFAIIARTAWHEIGQRMGTILVWVNKSFSRGEVRLKSADPSVEPEVDFNLLSDPRDTERLKEGFRKAAEVLSDPNLKGVCGPVFPTSYSERVKKISAPGAWNTFQIRLLSTLLDRLVPLRDFIIHSVVTLGLSLKKLLSDDTALTQFVEQGVAGVWHASGTCRMGNSSDPAAVTDGSGKVHGVEALRVCDSSIMPSIPRANTNLPTIMLAECLADRIKGGA